MVTTQSVSMHLCKGLPSIIPLILQGKNKMTSYYRSTFFIIYYFSLHSTYLHFVIWGSLKQNKILFSYLAGYNEKHLG